MKIRAQKPVGEETSPYFKNPMLAIRFDGHKAITFFKVRSLAD